MGKTDPHTYDAVIIGAGIGGLVCGCSLAKAGMKVLIAEQHHKPGGYCTSFTRKGFTFDAAPHCFGSYREGGLTRKILQDLGVNKKLNIIRSDPTDIIIAPDYKIHIWNDLEKTAEELQISFPEEGNNVREFLHFVCNADPNAFSRLRKCTFQDVLDKHFSNKKLKSILAAPLLAFHGLPPSLMSAFVGSKLFSEFLLDGGYYPQGGMQTLPDAIAEKFKEFGGELRLSSFVKKIKIQDDKVIGIVTEDEGFIPSKYVVSACDARQTFFQFIDKEKVEKEFRDSIKEMMPSLSNFLLYLGVDRDFDSPLDPGIAYCFCPHYDLDRMFHAAKRNDINNYTAYTVKVSHDKSMINAYMLASYKSKRYWEKNKLKIAETFISKIEKHIPNLLQYILHKDAATPCTLNRYTLNYKGASYGWAGIPSQFAVPGFRKPSFIKNLYLTGHWTTFGVGISGVVYFAYDTARIILRKEKK